MVSGGADEDYVLLESGESGAAEDGARQQKSGNQSRTACKLLLLALALLLCITGVFAFFIWPREPNVELQGIRFAGLKLHTHKLPKVLLDVNLDVNASVHNPNFFAVRYDTIRVLVNYRGDELGKVNCSEGRIQARSTTYVNASMELEGLEVLSHAAELISDFADKRLPLKTELLFEGNVEILGLISPRVKASVSCKLLVDPSNNTVLEQDCKLEHARLFVLNHSSIGSSSSKRGILDPKAWYMILLEVILGLLLVAIIVRLLWPMPPEIEVEAIELLGLTASSNFPGESMIPNVVLDINLRIRLMIRNPNFIGCCYDVLTIYLYYYEYEVAKGEFVGGSIGARDTAHVDGTLDLRGVEIAWNASQLLADYAKSALPLSIFIEFSGSVGNVVCRPPVKGAVQYNMVLDPSTNEVVESSPKLKSFG